VLFQVSFNDPDNILFPNATKNSILDCGYKALAALGLRNLQRSLMESNLVNRRGQFGIDSRDLQNYIKYIFDLTDANPVGFNLDDLYGGPLLTTAPIIGDDAIIQNKFTADLLPNYATIFVVKLEDNRDMSHFFYHYLIAYKVRNTIYYYNPQTNITRNPTEMYLSTNLRELLKKVYPLYHLEDDYGYFYITQHGVPKPVIKNRLKRILAFSGGGARHRRQHSRVCKSRKIYKLSK
jgi:hypothetical protein